MLMPHEVQNLCIFLAKPRHASASDALHLAACLDPLDVPIPGYGKATLFVARTAAAHAAAFKNGVDIALLGIPGLEAALCLQVDGRYFVLVFGSEGRLLLQDHAFEERFGLLCTLNSVDPDSFRCCGEEWIEGQCNAVVGRPSDLALGRRMAGSDSLCVEVSVRLSGLPGLLSEYKKKFEAI